MEFATRSPQLLIVDGQQRLTSLFAVLTGRPVLTKSFEQRRIRIAFRPEDQTFEVADAAIERDAHFIPDITALWSSGYKTTLRQFFERLDKASDEEIPDVHKDELEERIDRVRDLRDFRFQVVELGASANEEQVAEIFVRINSEGVKLNQSDFILTLMSVHWEKGRRQLEDFSRAAVDPAVTGPSPRNPFLDPGPDQLLRVAVAVAFRRARLQHVYNILRGKDLESGKVSAERRQEQFGVLAAAHEKVLDLTSWHDFLKCVAAAGFRSRKMITSDNALLFSYTLWLIGRHDFGIEVPTLRPAIARWFFMAHTVPCWNSGGGGCPYVPALVSWVTNCVTITTNNDGHSRVVRDCHSSHRRQECWRSIGISRFVGGKSPVRSRPEASSLPGELPRLRWWRRGVSLTE
jgi:hypothetical protein